MSLVRLLTTGKSLVGLKESVNRYRVTGQRLLPKFEAKKNPFVEGAQHPSADKKAPGEPLAEEATGEVGGQRPAVAPSVEPTVAPSPAGRREYRFARAWSRCSALAGRLCFWRREESRQVTGRRQVNGLFQAELSLEAVKVVRNDLSDSDVEVKPVPLAVAAQRSAANAAAPEERPAKPTLARVTERLFGAAKR